MRLHNAESTFVDTHRTHAKVRVRPRDREACRAVHTLHHTDETLRRDNGEKRLHAGIGTGRQRDGEFIAGSASRQKLSRHESILQSCRKTEQLAQRVVLVGDSLQLQRLRRHLPARDQDIVSRDDRRTHG